MARESGGGKVNIGAASLVLIFIVLCLATFGLLSLSSAKGDLSLAERQAEAVSAYYAADSKEWVRQVDAVLQEEMGHSDDSSSASDAVKARLGEIYHQDEGMVVTDIPMERGQSLRIELTLVCGEGMRYQIHSWYVYDSGQYEIDNSMPVWDGSSGA